MTNDPNRMKLNARQEAFCREYLKDLNATKAAIRAGYSEKSSECTSSRLIGNAKLQVRIAELQSTRNARTEISADQTLADIREMADMALGRKAYAKTVTVDGEPQVIMVKNVSFAGAAKALELLCRHQGLLNDKLAVNHGGLSEVLEALSGIPSSTPAGRIKAREGNKPH